VFIDEENHRAIAKYSQFAGWVLFGLTLLIWMLNKNRQ
jgi:hypothetical protein